MLTGNSFSCRFSLIPMTRFPSSPRVQEPINPPSKPWVSKVSSNGRSGPGTTCQGHQEGAYHPIKNEFYCHGAIWAMIYGISLIYGYQWHLWVMPLKMTKSPTKNGGSVCWVSYMWDESKPVTWHMTGGYRRGFTVFYSHKSHLFEVRQGHWVGVGYPFSARALKENRGILSPPLFSWNKPRCLNHFETIKSK